MEILPCVGIVVAVSYSTCLCVSVSLCSSPSLLEYFIYISWISLEGAAGPACSLCAGLCRVMARDEESVLCQGKGLSHVTVPWCSSVRMNSASTVFQPAVLLSHGQARTGMQVHPPACRKHTRLPRFLFEKNPSQHDCWCLQLTEPVMVQPQTATEIQLSNFHRRWVGPAVRIWWRQAFV